MRDTLWFVVGTLLICFFVLQIAGIPFVALPFLIIGSVVLGVVLMLVFLAVTLPGRLWRSRRRQKQ